MSPKHGCVQVPPEYLPCDSIEGDPVSGFESFYFPDTSKSASTNSTILSLVSSPVHVSKISPRGVMKYVLNMPITL